MIVDILVEGLLDEAVARRLIIRAGHRAGTTFGLHGAPYLRQKAAGFNVRARYGNPILMLVDFADTSLDCPPAVPLTWLPDRSPEFLLRVVVNEIESWLLADPQGIADMLGISRVVMPDDPERLDDPKQTLVNLARRSRRKFAQALVPQPGISASVGPGYVSAMQAFVAERWNIEIARQRAASLDRCLLRLGELRSFRADIL